MEDLHVAILQFGKDRLESGVTFEDVHNHIVTAGYNVSKERMETYIFQTYEPLDRNQNADPLKYLRLGEKFSLTIESTFRLIEYEEFKRSYSQMWCMATCSGGVPLTLDRFLIYSINKFYAVDDIGQSPKPS